MAGARSLCAASCVSALALFLPAAALRAQPSASGYFAYQVSARARGWIVAEGLDGSGLRRLLPPAPRGWGALDWSPDGTKLAAAHLGPDRYAVDAIVIARTDGRPRVVVPSPRGLTSEDFRWSPTGNRLAFVRESRTDYCHASSLWMVRADGTALRRVLKPIRVRSSNVSLVGWSPNGQRLLYVRTSYEPGECGRTGYEIRSALMTVGLDGSRPKVVARRTILILDADWSPNGDHIAYLICDESCRIWTVAAAGGQPRQVGPAVNSVDVPSVTWTRDGSEILIQSFCRVGKCVTEYDCNPSFNYTSALLAIDAVNGRVRAVVQRPGCEGADLLTMSRDGLTLGFQWFNLDKLSAERPSVVGIDGHGLEPLPQPQPDVRGAKVDLSSDAMYLP